MTEPVKMVNIQDKLEIEGAPMKIRSKHLAMIIGLTSLSLGLWRSMESASIEELVRWLLIAVMLLAAAVLVDLEES